MQPRLIIKSVSEDKTFFVVQFVNATTSPRNLLESYIREELSKIEGEIISGEQPDEFCLSFGSAQSNENIIAAINRARQKQNSPFNEEKFFALEQKRGKLPLQGIRHPYNNARLIQKPVPLMLQRKNNKLLDKLLFMGTDGAINQCIFMPASVEVVNGRIEITFYLYATVNKKIYDPKEVRQLLLAPDRDADSQIAATLVNDFFDKVRKKFPEPVYTIEPSVIDGSRVVVISFYYQEVICELSGKMPQQLTTAISMGSLLKSYMDDFNFMHPDLRGEADQAIAHCLGNVFFLLQQRSLQETTSQLAAINPDLANAVLAVEKFALTPPLMCLDTQENKPQEGGFISKLRDILQQNQLDFSQMESFSLHPFMDFLLLKSGRKERMRQTVWDVQLLFFAENENGTFLVIKTNNEPTADSCLLKMNTANLVALLPEFEDYLARHYNDYMTLRSVICQHANQETMYVLVDLLIQANFAAARNPVVMINQMASTFLLAVFPGTFPADLVNIVRDYLLDVSGILEPFKKEAESFNAKFNCFFALEDRKKYMKIGIDSNEIVVKKDPAAVERWAQVWDEDFKKQEEQEEEKQKHSDFTTSLASQKALMQISGFKYSVEAGCLRMEMHYHRMFKPKAVTQQAEPSTVMSAKNKIKCGPP